MNEIEQRARRAQGWQRILDLCGVKHHWEWCLYVGLYETADWRNRNDFRWSK